MKSDRVMLVARGRGTGRKAAEEEGSLHNAKGHNYISPNRNSTGEPCALKGAITVRRGVVEKVT
jgi:hypothetical protein